MPFTPHQIRTKARSYNDFRNPGYTAPGAQLYASLRVSIRDLPNQISLLRSGDKMSNRAPSVISKATFWRSVFRPVSPASLWPAPSQNKSQSLLTPFALLLLAICTACGGASSGGRSTAPGAPPPPPPTPGIESNANFGMQCGPGDTQDCGNEADTAVVWPSTQAQPGLVRLHDAGTQWAVIDSIGGGNYQWGVLDQWLDQIALHHVYAIQVFSWVPCWDAPTCSSPPTAPAGTNSPPSDLTASGSPAFNNFVTAFTQHCSPAGNCVSKYIKYYEMWNEWDLQFHWTGSMQQVFNMVAPASTIIRNNVPNAVILMPSTTPSSDTGNGFQADFQSWLNLENSSLVNGKHLSDWITWHVYLTAQVNNTTQIDTPENQWTNFNQKFLDIEQSTSGWANAPWANTETNYNGSPSPGLNYTCPTSSSPNPPVTFSAADCAGMIARWQILHDSNGAASLDWYKWNETIGGNSPYETVYFQMMQYLVGGKFTQACGFTAGNGASTWTCGFTEQSGTQALWVWTPNEAGTTFTVPSGYTDYKDLQGNTHNVTAGGSITIGVQPFLLEQ